MKRTMAHIKSMLPLKKHSEIHKPLFNIELDHVILGELHLMMRVAGCLTENLITEVKERDCNNINKGRLENKGIYLESLVTTINKLGIPFSLWAKKNADGKGSGAYEWTSLVGSDRKKKLTELLPAQLEQNNILFPETRQALVTFPCTLQDYQ